MLNMPRGRAKSIRNMNIFVLRLDDRCVPNEGDQNSMTGYCIYVSGNLIMWCSLK